ncbi:hypothetical protein HDU79_000443 [Rhizoclosmatium sp. JEL0117]|nr:hypothetical protein HDU79_000443 [Rhizoclosmatium sp. JEL0117]
MQALPNVTNSVPDPFVNAQEEFLAALVQYHESIGQQTTVPDFCGQPVNLFHLFLLVQQVGGYEKMDFHDWQRIVGLLKPPKPIPEAPLNLKNIYERTLWLFELHTKAAERENARKDLPKVKKVESKEKVEKKAVNSEKKEKVVKEKTPKEKVVPKEKPKNAAPAPPKQATPITNNQASASTSAPPPAVKIPVPGPYIPLEEPLVIPDKPTDSNEDENEDGKDYFVEAILGFAIDEFEKKLKKPMYLVKWLGYTNKFNQWLDETSFTNDVLISKYKKAIEARTKALIGPAAFDAVASSSSATPPQKEKKEKQSTSTSNKRRTSAPLPSASGAKSSLVDSVMDSASKKAKKELAPASAKKAIPSPQPQSEDIIDIEGPVVKEEKSIPWTEEYRQKIPQNILNAPAWDEYVLEVKSVDNKMVRDNSDENLFRAVVTFKEGLLPNNVTQRTRSSQRITPPRPLVIPDKPTDLDEDEGLNSEYEVEGILDHKTKGNRTLYLVKWAGYTNRLNDWLQEDMFGDGNLVAEYKKKMKSFGTEKRGRGTKTDEKGIEEKKVEKPAPKKGRKRSLSAAKSIEAENKEEEEEEVVEEQDVKVSSKNSKSTDSQRKRAKTKASKTSDSDKPVEEDIPAVAEENQDDLFEDDTIPEHIYKLSSWDEHVQEIASLDNPLYPDVNDENKYRVKVVWKKGVLGKQSTSVYLTAGIVREKCRAKLIDFFFKHTRFVK